IAFMAFCSGLPHNDIDRAALVNDGPIVNAANEVTVVAAVIDPPITGRNNTDVAARERCNDCHGASCNAGSRRHHRRPPGDSHSVVARHHSAASRYRAGAVLTGPGYAAPGGDYGTTVPANTVRATARLDVT